MGKVAVVAALVSLGTGCNSRARSGAGQDGSTEARPMKAPFACSGDRCVQRYPRFPDDGEWTCSDMGGVAVCSGGDFPAGIPFNLSDPAWICGERHRGAAAHAERVCVDLAPDFPNGAARGWRCHYATDDGPARLCDRDANAHVIGDACDARAPCLDGFRCTAGLCTPESPSPSCVLDGDCEMGVCRFGSCWRGPT
jgi:hypothetical protein